MNQFRAYLEKTFKLADADWQQFSSMLIRQELPKRTIILHQGQTEKYISFVEKGSIRFFVPKQDDECTFAFIFEDELVCAYDSFLTQLPARYCAEILTPTILWRFSYETVQKLYQEIPISNVLGRIASEEIYRSSNESRVITITRYAGRTVYENLCRVP